MKWINPRLPTSAEQPSHSKSNRRGAVMVLAAVMMVLLLAVVAFAVDVGYLAATKTQLQTAADASVLAAALELESGLGLAPDKSQTAMQTVAKTAAVDVAGRHKNGDLASTYLNPNSHVRFGRIAWNSATNKWVKTWGATPANVVEVTTHRDSAGSNSTGQGDRPVDLFFAPIIGKEQGNLAARAIAGVVPGVGFGIPAGSTMTFGALPIACDQDSWNALVAGTGSDNYSYNVNNGSVSSGHDNVKELNIYPDPNANLPSGNRGTVDLGNPNNSASDLKRQILYGQNEADLAFFPNHEIRTDNGPLIINGDTGISAGIKADLEAIKGQPRLMPIYTVVGSLQQATSGNMNGKKASGNNVYYRVVKFVGVRIVFVELTGNNKRVIIQPATFSSSLVIPDKTGAAASPDTYYTKAHLFE